MLRPRTLQKNSRIRLKRSVCLSISLARTAGTWPKRQPAIRRQGQRSRKRGEARKNLPRRKCELGGESVSPHQSALGFGDDNFAPPQSENSVPEPRAMLSHEEGFVGTRSATLMGLRTRSLRMTTLSARQMQKADADPSTRSAASEGPCKALAQDDKMRERREVRRSSGSAERVLYMLTVKDVFGA